jgi:hypothetical protein
MSTRRSFQEPEVEDDPGNWAGPYWAAPEEEGKEELGWLSAQERKSSPFFYKKNPILIFVLKLNCKFDSYFMNQTFK